MKNPPYLKNIARVVAALVAIAAATSTLNAQTQVYTQSFDADDSANWAVNIVSASPATSFNGANLNFDYSTVGIPSAPNSTGGTTKGLKVWANLGAGGSFPAGCSASPTNFPITDNFEMHFDMWLNYVKSGVGSTEVGGAGYGTAGTSAQVAGNVLDSTVIGIVTDHGSSASVRVYGSLHSNSYQDGYFIIGSNTNGLGGPPNGDPSSGYVYAGTNRNSNNGYYAPFFPTQACPADQTNLFPRQTGLVAPIGNCSFKWHDVSLRKVANLLTYKIDGNLIATVDVTDAGVVGGQYLLFNMFDTGAGGSTDIDSTNLQFALFDNIRVTNFTSVVSVTNTINATAEGSATDGIFTIVRTSTGVPITVNYTLSGSASNGVDYTSLPGSVTFSAFATQTNIFVHPIDDSVAELAESVILTVSPDPNFTAGGNATITISDNEPTTLTITNVSTQMYERTNDYAKFLITRLGDTNTTFSVNLAFAGTATSGVDYYPDATVTFDLGVATTNFSVYPIADASYEGVETVTALITSGSYAIGSPSSASINLVDANTAAESVIYSENFNTDHSANWTQIFVANDGVPDSVVDFNFNYSSFGIPDAPHGGGNGLFLNVNKDLTGSAAAINLYPNGGSFSGNFALRFDMFLSVPLPNSSATEYALAGINHSGTKTNWWRSGGVPAGGVFDGLFCAITTDSGASPSYALYSSPTTGSDNPTQLASQTGTAMASALKLTPWAVAGAPGNLNSASTFLTPIWADVELSKIDNIVSLRINNNTVYSYSNATAYASGNIMLGYEDAFDSISPVQSYMVIDNVRVVSVAGLNITAIQDLGASVQIDFTFGLNDAPTAFEVQGASVVTGPYAAATATIVQLTPGTYRATVAKSGDAQFYRIRHL